jgi:hypothetical protein
MPDTEDGKCSHPKERTLSKIDGGSGVLEWTPELGPGIAEVKV